MKQFTFSVMLSVTLGLASLSAQQHQPIQEPAPDIDTYNAQRYDHQRLTQQALNTFFALPDKAEPNGNYRQIGYRYDPYDNVSSAWTHSDSSVYNYDANNGLLASIIYKSYDNITTTWKLSYRYNYTYTSEGWESQYIGQTWNGAAWDNSYRQVNTYDANGNRTSYITYTWDGSAWKESSKYVMVYNADNLMEFETYFTWSAGWNPVWKDSYGFDANGNNISYLYQSWDGSSWKNNYRSLTTFNGNNKETSYLGQTWDNITSAWTNAYHDTTIYSIGSYVTTVSYWDNVTSTWEYSDKYSYTLSGTDMTLIYLYQSWDNVASAWENQYRYTYTYDAQDNQLTEFDETWDDIISSWVNDSRSTYQYNNGNYILYELYEYWNDITSSWVNSSRYYYRYEADPFVSVEDLSATYQLNLYPNPATDHATLYFNTDTKQDVQISVITLDGKHVFTQLLNQVAGATQHSICTEGWNKGLYLVRIQTNDGLMTKKLIVQ